MAFFSWILHVIRNPDELIRLSGYPLLFLMMIIFAETGAMVFFLPGDSLLVTAGLYAARGSLDILQLNLLLIPMAILGDALSYLIGKKTGPALFSRPKSRWFNPQHLRDAHAFYEKHGGKTIIYAKFVPIIRTFAPFVAGVAKMPYGRFLSFDIFGAIGWVCSMTILGYMLGEVAIVRRHFEKFVLLVIFVSLLPLVTHALRAKFQRKAVAGD